MQISCPKIRKIISHTTGGPARHSPRQKDYGRVGDRNLDLPHAICKADALPLSYTPYNSRHVQYGLYNSKICLAREGMIDCLRNERKGLYVNALTQSCDRKYNRQPYVRLIHGGARQCNSSRSTLRRDNEPQLLYLYHANQT